MPKSLLPEIDLNEAIQSHDAGLLAGAQERYTTQVGRAHSGLVKLADKAAAQHDNATDANNAAADLLQRFSDAVEAHGDNIVAGIAQSNNQSASQAAQVLELEGQVAQLERSAHRASNLQATLDQRDAEVARLQRELSASQAEAQQLRQAAGQPNPLNERNRQLETEVNDLRVKLTDAEDANAQLQQELEVVQGELDEANNKIAQLQASSVPAQQAPPKDPDADAAQPQTPSVDPDSQSSDPGDPSDPQTMVGGFQGQPTPAQPKKKGPFARARQILS